jgi:hypothetical protein
LARKDGHDALLEATEAVEFVELECVEVVESPLAVAGLEDTAVAVGRTREHEVSRESERREASSADM